VPVGSTAFAFDEDSEKLSLLVFAVFGRRAQ
jgi:hypothetical protein